MLKTNKMLVFHNMMFQWLVKKGMVLQRLMKKIPILLLYVRTSVLSTNLKVQIPIQISSVIYVFLRINIFQPSLKVILNNSSFQLKKIVRIFRSTKLWIILQIVAWAWFLDLFLLFQELSLVIVKKNYYKKKGEPGWMSC